MSTAPKDTAAPAEAQKPAVGPQKPDPQQSTPFMHPGGSEATTGSVTLSPVAAGDTVVPTPRPVARTVTAADFLPLIEMVGRRSWTTAEFITPAVGMLLGLLFGKLGVGATEGQQVAAEIAPPLVGILYSIVRTVFKWKVAQAVTQKK